MKLKVSVVDTDGHEVFARIVDATAAPCDSGASVVFDAVEFETKTVVDISGVVFSDVGPDCGWPGNPIKAFKATVHPGQTITIGGFDLV